MKGRTTLFETSKPLLSDSDSVSTPFSLNKPAKVVLLVTTCAWETKTDDAIIKMIEVILCLRALVY
jgi:hypothetical protein